MALRYRCLVLDHDDTVTDSTRCVHHPAFLDAMQKMRPGVSMDLDAYFLMNFEPGFLPYLEETLHFTPEEMDEEYEIWQSWVRRIIPDVFPGMKKLILRQKAAGGLVCVISHSMDFNIRRDYQANGLPEPDMVFGWEQPAERRKPSPWPVTQVAAHFGLEPGELLMVDDLKPGYDMARAAGIDFAAALWAHHVPRIRAFMHKNSPLCFETPEELEFYQFGSIS